MHRTHVPARATSLLSVALLLGTSLPLLAASSAEAGARYFEEDWEVGSNGWTYSTSQPIAQQDCTTRFAHRGVCSVEVNAQVKGQSASASRSFTNLRFDAEPGYVVSDYFQAEFPFAKSGCAKVVQFGAGVKATLNLSYGSGNQVALATQTPMGTAGTGPLTTPSGQLWMYDQATWYRVILKPDLVNDKLRVEIRARNDSLLATGPALPLPPGAAASIERISYESYYYGNGGLTERPAKCNFDWLQVTGPDAPVAPQFVTAIPGPGLGQVTVSWQAPHDDGGVPILYYNVYRGDSAGSVTTHIGNTTTRSFTDSGMANGETHYYAVRAVNAAGEGAVSNAFLGTTFNVPSAPRNLVAAPGMNVGEVRLTWQAPLDSGGTSISTYRVYRRNESSVAMLLTELGSALAYTDAHRPNGTRWYYNVTAVNFVGEGPSSPEVSSLPKSDGATVATAMTLRPDPWWTDQPRELNFTYSVAVSQCAPNETCPVAHEWRVYQDGSLTGADGILLASGTNTHDGHAGLTTYDISTSVTPTGLDGTHRLKVVLNPREGSTQWRLASLSFQNGLPQPDARCNSNPGYATYIMPGVATVPTTGKYDKTYRYVLNGTLSAHSAVFVDGCPMNGTLGRGDGHYEMGYGGLLLDHAAVGGKLQLLDSTGNLPSFVIGKDGDGNGVVGDHPLDCLQGPHLYVADVACPPDASGKIIVLLVPPPESQPGQLPSSADSIWGRSTVCIPIPGRQICPQIYVCDPCEGRGGGGGSGMGVPFQLDMEADRLGDAWVADAEQKAEHIDKVLEAALDQEFPSGQPCAPPSPGSCIGKGTGDSLTTLTEFRWGILPIGAVKACVPLGSNNCRLLLENGRDFDNDSWEDGEEHPYWNNVANDNVLDDPTWTAVYAAPRDPDAAVNFDADKPGTVFDPDNDNDGLLDGVEFKVFKSYPEFADSDCALDSANCSFPGPYWSPRWGEPGKGDQISDPMEHDAWFRLANATGLPLTAWKDDHDHDGIAPNLLDPDSDADGLVDGLEFNASMGGKCDLVACTSPAKHDTDRDGLLDGTDTLVPFGDYRVRLFVPSGIAYTKDAAGYLFYGEKTAGTNPANPDTDADTLPDGWELKYRTNPLVRDADNDTDQDNYVNWREYAYGCAEAPCPAQPVYWGGTNPVNPDSDGDGLHDGWEDDGDGKRAAQETSPLEPDTDKDGLGDGAEALNDDPYYRSDPWNADSDNDRLTDYQEVVTYAAKGISPNRANSDDCCNTTNNDTLTDYQEVVLYRTNASGLDANGNGLPDGWDTDGDNLADGRDAHPTRFDATPVQRTLPPLNPTRPKEDSYVVFRPEGYIDVIVTDAHGSEAEIESVEVWAKLEGTVDGAAGHVLVREEARRLDEQGTWGARIPLPERMSRAHTEKFSLTVTSLGGGNASATLESRAYGGAVNVVMDAVRWDAQTDPAGEWRSLRVHESVQTPAQTSVAAGHNGAPLVAAIPSLYSLSIEDVIETFGNVSVYRLKPGSVLASDLPNVTVEIADTSALAIAHPINETLGPENASVFVDFTYYEDAFALVNPLDEPGVYASMASGGNNYFRTPKFIHTGVKKVWDGAVTAAKEQGASFLFGSDDPRANGRIGGDVVSGILVYGDVRDCFWKEEWLTVTLGCIGIALTFVGPGADGPFAAFKAGVKTLTSIPTVGVKVAGTFALDVSTAVTIFKKSDKKVEALHFLVKQCASASWLRKNTAKAVPFDHVQRSVPAEMRNAVGDQLPLTVDYAESLRVGWPNDAAKVDRVLGILTRPNLMYTTGGKAALEDVGEVVARVRDAQPEGAGDFAKGIGYAAGKPNGASQLPGIEGADRWKNDVFAGIRGNNENGRKGYILEGKIVGRGGDRFYKIADVDRIDRIIDLKALDTTHTDIPLIEVIDGERVVVGRIAKVQVDVEGVMEGAGTRLFMDAKSADEIGAKEYDQMMHYAALAREHDGEVIWFLEGKPTGEFQNHAAGLANKYQVRIHLYDADTGAALNPYI